MRTFVFNAFVVMLLFSLNLLFSDELTINPNQTFEKNPRFQEIHKQIRQVREQTENYLGPSGCQALELVLGKNPLQIMDHYSALGTDLASLVTSLTGSNLDAAEGSQAYESVSGWMSIPDVQDTLARLKQYGDELDKDPTLKESLNWAKWLDIFGGNVKKAMLAMILDDDFVKSAYQSKAMYSDPEFVKLSTTLLRDKDYHEFSDLNEKLDLAASKDGSISLKTDEDLNSLYQRAEKSLSSKELKRFKELAPKYQPTNVSLVNIIIKIREKSTFFKQVDERRNLIRDCGLYKQLGFSHQQNPYKETSGLILATGLYEKGYSKPDIEFAISRASLGYEVIDFLYDHLGRKNKFGSSPVVRDNSSFSVSNEAYANLLTRLREYALIDPDLQGELLAASIGMPQTAKHLPQEVRNQVDIKDDEQLTGLILALYIYDQESFDRKILPLFKSMTDQDKKNILSLMSAAKRDVERTVEGARFAVDILSASKTPQVEKKWEGAFTGKVFERIQGMCTSASVTKSIGGAVKRIWEFVK